jgi:hypothetical protein
VEGLEASAGPEPPRATRRLGPNVAPLHLARCRCQRVAAEDEALAEVELEARSLFDMYLNVCPQQARAARDPFACLPPCVLSAGAGWQGSRTIRTEEALFLGLGALRPHVERANE